MHLSSMKLRNRACFPAPVLVAETACRIVAGPWSTPVAPNPRDETLRDGYQMRAFPTTLTESATQLEVMNRPQFQRPGCMSNRVARTAIVVGREGLGTPPDASTIIMYFLPSTSAEHGVT